VAKYRPDLTAWLDKVIGRAISANPADRYQDVLELVFEMEHGAGRASPVNVAHMPPYHRNPLLSWKVTAALLAALLAISVLSNSGKNSADRARAEMKSSSK
jgi:hypothetical protein